MHAYTICQLKNHFGPTALKSAPKWLQVSQCNWPNTQEPQSCQKLDESGKVALSQDNYRTRLITLMASADQQLSEINKRGANPLQGCSSTVSDYFQQQSSQH